MNLLLWPNKVSFEPGYRSPPYFLMNLMQKFLGLLRLKPILLFQNNERDEILCLLPLQKGWILVYVKGCSNDSLVLAAVEGVMRDANCELSWGVWVEFR